MIITKLEIVHGIHQSEVRPHYGYGRGKQTGRRIAVMLKEGRLDMETAVAQLVELRDRKFGTGSNKGK